MKRFLLMACIAAVLIAFAAISCSSDDDDDSSGDTTGNTDAMDEYEQILSDIDALAIQHGDASPSESIANVSTYCDLMDEQMGMLEHARQHMPDDCPGVDGHGGMMNGDCCPWSNVDLEHLVEHEGEARLLLEDYRAQCGDSPPGDEACAAIRDEHVHEMQDVLEHTNEYCEGMRDNHGDQRM
jgi:hypothetical protein